MDILALAFLISLIANRLIEALVRPIKVRLEEVGIEHDFWYLIYVSWVVGGLLAYFANVNLIAEYVPGLPEEISLILSAIVIGGGANLIADIFGKPKGE